MIQNRWRNKVGAFPFTVNRWGHRQTDREIDWKRYWPLSFSCNLTCPGEKKKKNDNIFLQIPVPERCFMKLSDFFKIFALWPKQQCQADHWHLHWLFSWQSERDVKVVFKPSKWDFSLFYKHLKCIPVLKQKKNECLCGDTTKIWYNIQHRVQN